MKIIDYINKNFSIGKRLFYGKWELNYGDCKNRANLNKVSFYYSPLSITLEHDFDLDEFGTVLNLSLENLPDWFKDKIKCKKDDNLPYVEYFDGFKKSLNDYNFNLAYASGMRDFLNGFFRIDKSVCFCDVADFLHNFGLHYEKVLPKNESKLIAYYENSNQIRAVIDGRLYDEYVNFIDYEESPCAMISYSYAFSELECYLDLDNLFDISISGYSGVEGYAFGDDFDISEGEIENPNLINVSNRDYLPKKITFYNYDYGEERTLNIFKFSKAVLCNEPIIKWIEAGIRVFEEYLVEKIDDNYYLVSDDEKIKLDDSLRWCDLKGLKALDESYVWQERVKNYKTSGAIIKQKTLLKLEEKLKATKDIEKIKEIKRHINQIQSKLEGIE